MRNQMNVVELEDAIEKFGEIFALATAYANSKQESGGRRPWAMDSLDFDGCSFTANYSRYAGCGEYDHDSRYFGPSDLITYYEENVRGK